MPDRPPWTRSSDSSLSYALAYALKWQAPVFPVWWIQNKVCACGQACRSPGKHPIPKNGLNAASTDEATVRGWWEQWPRANIGMRTGQASGLFVVDVDPAKGGNVDYLDSLPDTLTAETGGGGRHYVFRAAAPVKNSVEELGPGIDVRGDGGYIVVEPSNHVSGSQYAWQDLDVLTDEAPAISDAPRWLLDKVQGVHGEAFTQKHRVDPNTFNVILPPKTVVDLSSALACVPADNYDRWIEIGMALHSTQSKQAKSIWDGWSQTCPDKYNQRVQDWKWRTFAPYEGLTIATVFKRAQDHGWKGTTAPGETGATGDLELIWLKDVAPVEAQSGLVQNTLFRHQMSIIYGGSGIGKSFFMIDIALHVAAGRPWHGLETLQTGVIYIAAEGAFGIRNRISAWKEYYSLTDLPFALIPTHINLRQPHADTQRLIDAIKRAAEIIDQPIGLVIIDTLAQAFAGGNENSSEDMGALVSNSNRIRAATDCHLAWVHHSGKDRAQGARGHSSLRAATDTEIELTRNGTLTQAYAHKQREWEEGEILQFTLTPFPLSNDQTSCILTPHIDLNGLVGRLQRPLTTKEMEALTVFEEIMIEVPETDETRETPWFVSPCFGIGKGTLKNVWRERSVTSRNNQDSERVQFNRLMKTLENKGQIKIHGEWVIKAKQA